MRHVFFGWLLTFFVMAAHAATPATLAAPASAPTGIQPASAAQANAAPALTPQQAQQALSVLENPQDRARVETTLRAIAAVGALSAPPAVASAPAAASSASAASAASTSAASAAPIALQSNGLASMLVHQGSRWATQIGAGLRQSLHSLLDVGSVNGWWRDTVRHADARADLLHAVLIILAVLIPAFAIEWIAKRLLRRLLTELAARRDAATPPDAASSAESPESRGHGHAQQHKNLLGRMPRAFVTLLLRLLPLLVFAGVASLMMSLLVDDDTPVATALGSLIDIYVICRLITLVSRLFFQPDAPQLRLLHIGDTGAAFAQRWIMRIALVVGVCTALVEIAANFGLSDAGHMALLKSVALIGHLLVSVLIIRCARPVATRIRAYCAKHPSLAMVGGTLASAWAPASIFVVMALWFIWALDVHNGYRVLITLGGRTLAVIIGMRLLSIVLFGALSRAFERRDEERTLVHRHAYRYYPLVRGVVSTIVGIISVALLLQVWGVPVWQTFESSTIGHRLASALITIAIAAAIALVVWEAANIAIERRLQQWTHQGDVMRAARLRTLLPMLRALLFSCIALVVILTGMSEIGVNIGPLLAGASIFGVALGFGSQKLVQDFITGIFLLMENALQVGDWVTLAGVSGTVEYLSIRTVRLRASDGSLYTVPFSSVTTVNNTNRGLGNAAVKVSIAYGEDIDRAVATLKEIGAALREDPAYRDGIKSDFSYWGVDQVDGAAIALSGQMQCTDTTRWGVQREFNRRIADRFREQGIRIANPQRSTVAFEDGVPHQ
ncbi:Moderate conductance mechanosensitive channel YbiO [Pandoraea iniqua]|uniref:Moderate conductance mechanosensitive channel YbiO n=1 Tax=Pandoraea iniqua TaxID=2508288 RepID=A0A5E4SY90_9BURK|nr:mechanosensitive ion channel domain-containing protein [Pandoraea iniqua]VVD79154.1 Moderate conductance mechanosensitive channel YbiO [Pandoraea iniqua]